MGNPPTPVAALDRLLALAQPVGAEVVALDLAWGRTLAAPLMARRDSPPFAVAAMDGYAICQTPDSSVTTPSAFRVAGRSHAGDSRPSTALEADTAWRVFTGAPVPCNASRVIMQEDVTTREAATTEKGLGAIIEVPPPESDASSFIRPQGFDFAHGDPFFADGHRLTARDISLAASLGYPFLRVRRHPRVGILSTGNELALPGEPLEPGQIYSANGHAYATMIRAFGGTPCLLPAITDNLDALVAVLRHHKTDCDVLVSSGGVSVGDKDFIRQAVLEAGFEVVVHGIAMQPGKPVLFAQHPETHQVFVGLPGNPVSVLVSSAFFLSPLLRHMTGDHSLPWGEAAFADAILGVPLAKGGKRTAFYRARLEEHDEHGRVVVPFSRQDSSLLTLSSLAETLLIHEAHADPKAAGTPVKTLPFPPSVFAL